METIKNYLETMFQNLPDTPEVQKAKAELLSMMEDKYTELLNEGHTENEAIGTVISEFGNLDELAEDLGIVSLVRPAAAGKPLYSEEADSLPQKFLPAEEAHNYLKMQRSHAILTALGVFLCIICPIPVIFTELTASDMAENIGAACILFLVAIAVALFIYSSVLASKYSYIGKEGYVLDEATTAAIKAEQEKYSTRYALLLSAGVILCILASVPAILLESANLPNEALNDALSGAGVLCFVAIGVFLIVFSGIQKDGYKNLLTLNGQDNDYHSRHNTRDPHVSNPTVAAILSVYWPTITCIYLIWSFLTFQWHFTWIIWPIAGIFRKIMVNIWADKEN